MNRGAAASGLALALVGLGSLARAQAPTANGQSPPTIESTGAAPERAAVFFDRGLRSFESRAFEPALEDFRKSLELYPTPAATKNAALCLRELGRFDEALDLLEALSERFPDLPAEEVRLNQKRVDDLSAQVGWVELRGVEPSSQLVIDGRERGTVPPGSRIRISKGSRRIRLTKEGMLPAELSVVATPGQTTTVDVDQRPSESESIRPWTLNVELGAAVTPALGGEVAGCPPPCDRSIGAGGRIIGRAGRALGKTFPLTLDAGYLAVGQNIDGRRADAVAVGHSTNPGIASDSLSMKGGLVGLSVAYRLPSTFESFVRVGAGSFFGWVRDERRGTLETATTATTPAMPYPVVQSQRQPAIYGYLSLAFGIGFRPASALRVGAGLDAMAMVALRQPQWDASCGQACMISGGRDGDAWFPSDHLAGRFVMLVSPFVDAGYAF